jgi:hypothetical protein
MSFDFPVHELQGSPLLTRTGTGYSGNRQFLIPWDKQAEFENAFYPGGLPATWPNISKLAVAAITFSTMPSQTPDQNALLDPNVATATYLTRAGFNDGKPRCFVNVDYATPTTEIQREGAFTYSRNNRGDVYTVPGREMYWYRFLVRELHDDTGATRPDIHANIIEWTEGQRPAFFDLPAAKLGEDLASPIRVQLIEHDLTWHGVQYPQFEVLDWLQGTVNDRAFTMKVINQEFAAETLLLENVRHEIELSRDTSSTGAVFEDTWRVHMRFLEKRVTFLGDATIDWEAYRIAGSPRGQEGNYLKHNLFAEVDPNDPDGDPLPWYQDFNIGWNHVYDEDAKFWDKPIVIRRITQQSPGFDAWQYGWLYNVTPFGELFKQGNGNA